MSESIQRGTITIRWIGHESGGGVLDMTALVDNWQWFADGGSATVGADPVGTRK
jgi:hypothetical protein